MSFTEADTAQELAQDLIERYHGHLQQAKIRWLFTEQTGSKASLCTPLLRYLTAGPGSEEDGADFLVVIDEAEWESLTEPGREALLDHLLSRCGLKINEQSGSQRWVVRRPEVEEFAAVVQRHGPWRAELRAMKSALFQPGLFDTSGQPESVELPVMVR